MQFDISEDPSGLWLWTLADDRSGPMLCSSVRFRTQVQAYADVAAFKAMVSGAGVLVGRGLKRRTPDGGQLGLL